MTTRAVTARALVVPVLFVLAVFGVTLFFWKSFGGSTPLEPKGYRFHATFGQAPNLAPNADVRISGISVGEVVRVTRAGERTGAEIEIDARFAPLPADVRAILRTKTLLGETFVELSPGSPGAPRLADGGRLPLSQVEATQQLDQVLASFDGPTRRALKRLVLDLAAGLEGRGADVNAALGHAEPALDGLGTVVAALDQEREALRSLIRDAGAAFVALGRREGDLQSFVTAGDSVLSAVAARDRDLTRTVRALPPFLRELRTTFAAYERTGREIAPTVRELRRLAPGMKRSLEDVTALAPKLSRLFRGLRPVMRAARRGLPAATRMLSAALPLLRVMHPAGRDLVPVYELIGAYKRDIASAVAKAAAAMQASTTARDGRRVHYLRTLPPILNEGLVGFSSRLGTNRHNPYLRPGALEDHLRGGLRAIDCRNAGDPSIPPPGPGAGAPPCREQEPWRLGDDPPRSFPHVERAER